MNETKKDRNQKKEKETGKKVRKGRQKREGTRKNDRNQIKIDRKQSIMVSSEKGRADLSFYQACS